MYYEIQTRQERQHSKWMERLKKQIDKYIIDIRQIEWAIQGERKRVGEVREIERDDDRENVSFCLFLFVCLVS